MFAREKRTMRAGAGLWLFCLQFFVAEQIARLGWTGHYSMQRNYISDLGAAHLCSLYWLMNGSFVLQGMLIFLGAVLLRRFISSGWDGRAAFCLLALAGIGVLVVGLVPEGVFPFHLLGAAGNFLGGNLAMALLGFRSKSWVTFAAGSVGLLATVAVAFSFGPSWAANGWDAGTVERLAAYPLPLWLTWTGFLLLRDGRARFSA